MKKILIIFFLITGCSHNQNDQKTNASKIDFAEDITFKEFKIKLKAYAENSGYPNIDN